MGKPKHSNDTRGEQKGAQQHDEGQYGPKAFEAKWAEITDHTNADRARGSERAANDPNNDGKTGAGEAALQMQEAHDPSMRDGRHRLYEERKQHDEADRASGKDRLIADVTQHKHDKEEFQIPNGRTNHPNAPHKLPDHMVHSPGESGK